MSELPVELDTEEFREGWALWEQHRKEIKKKLTPTSIKMQLKRLAGWGEKRAIAAIYYSIAQGYQSCYEEKVFTHAVAAPTPKVRGQQETKPNNVVEISPEMQTANIKRLSEMFKKGGVL